MLKLKLLQQVDTLMVRLRSYSELIIRAVFFFFFLYLRVFIHDLMDMALARWRFLPPDLWPSWVLNIAILLSGILLVGGIKDYYLEKKGSQKAKDEEIKLPVDSEVATDEEDQQLVEEATSKELIRVLVFVTMVFIYIFLLPRLGYFVTTFLFPIAYLLYFKERRLIYYIVFPVASVGGIYILFTKLLAAPLPRGIGIFYEFSTLIH